MVVRKAAPRKAAPAKRAPAKVTTPDVTVYADKPATEYHKAYARWIVKEVGFNPDSVSSQRAAFLRGVSLATSARTAFQNSDYLAEWYEVNGINKRGPKPAEEEAAPAPKTRTRKPAPAPIVEEEDYEEEDFEEDFEEEEEAPAPPPRRVAKKTAPAKKAAPAKATRKPATPADDDDEYVF